ncbi:DUF4145 domain-containing protein [Paenibacillus sp. SEL3]|uniref:DUF4145 domain-containing protein n=1 Tax=Paenibacillus polymyxa (strain SC2) TaxID=886882 RepID=E3E8M5_PAEPS|nr:hypothetical protein [Paenibacillus polymyxa]ADO57734.1 hypothetical protein PPSC2_17670 [Paenibacillus polymyxa SC2]AJE53062.1 hypothetical protein RE92_19495 [Paenibacillus polymyxa]MDY8094490.1 hypothetical protein [Paenibacillus polymyxa]MEE4562928.1 hypothetical protein [Paenibacillus polymyxa]QOH63096.1 hypothetical protein DI243_17485 [Paenibacillus polymyxa]
MEFSEVIDFLSNDNSYWSSRGHEEIDIPFDVTPSEYLSFAEFDLESGTEKHSLINALSNAKRSLDCQIDCLMIAFGFFGNSKKWNVPKKIETLKNLGIIAPRILNKINSVRNLVEHEFVVPNKEQVSDFIDIVALFNASTEKHIFNFPGDSQIEHDLIKEVFLDIKFKRNQRNIKIEVREKGVTDRQIFNIDSSHDNYIIFMKHYIENFSKS